MDNSYVQKGGRTLASESQVYEYENELKFRCARDRFLWNLLSPNFGVKQP